MPYTFGRAAATFPDSAGARSYAWETGRREPSRTPMIRERSGGVRPVRWQRASWRAGSRPGRRSWPRFPGSGTR